ncbi:MAG: hypothetical protein HOP30_19645 [Cyclobacteriaceae bacterium]|nr:hypothetical protein [Cyclobacteriaceae bacterium]
MAKKIITAFVLTLVLTQFSCDKKNDPTPTTAFDQQLTASKGWVLTAANLSPPLQIPGAPAGTPAVSDFFNLFMDACEKDDIVFFEAEGGFKIEEGVIKCDPASGQVKLQGTWIYNSTSRAITITEMSSTDDSYSMTIEELNSTTMKLSQVIDFGIGSVTTLTTTYEKVK